MKRLGKKLALPVGAALLGLALPTAASAQSWGQTGSLDFSSSVNAACVGGAGSTWGGPSQCAFVEFRLDVLPDIWVQVWNVFLENPADPTSVSNNWAALPGPGGVVQLEDSGGNDLLAAGWTAGGANGGIEVLAQTGFDVRRAEPLTMVVAMASFGWGGDLKEMTYFGQGSVEQNGTGPVSFGGFVAPEPVSIALLATGLLGLGLVARKRERQDV